MSTSFGPSEKKGGFRRGVRSLGINLKQILQPQAFSNPTAPAGESANSGVHLPSTSASIPVDTHPSQDTGLAEPSIQEPNDPSASGLSESKSKAWVTLKESLEALRGSAKVFPLLQSAIGEILACLDLIQAASDHRGEFNELALTLNSMLRTISGHIFKPQLEDASDSINRFATEIAAQAKFIESKRTRGTGGRILEAGVDEQDVIKSYRRITASFRRLQLDTNLSILNTVDKIRMDQLLEKMAPVRDAKYNARPERSMCTGDTRGEVRTGLKLWAQKSGASKIYWMNGMAGTGKTTIACSFCAALEKELHQLGASFFFSRTASPDCRNVDRLVPNIAYQLAQYSFSFRSMLCKILDKDPEIGGLNPSIQFNKLIKEPILEANEAIPDGVVVVIDALDECDNLESIQSILDMMFESAEDLPIKFFVTSRPETEIYDKMLSTNGNVRTVFYLHNIDDSIVQKDITTYLDYELRKFMNPPPLPEQIKQLAHDARNLFIYASTAVRFIRQGKKQTNFCERLATVLEVKPKSTERYEGIDALYTAILARVHKPLVDSEKKRIQLVLRTSICAREPITIETLAALTGLADKEAQDSLEQLLSVLVFGSETKLVHALHRSFPDFMFDHKRSGEFHCCEKDHSRDMAQRCFHLMAMEKKGLRFNICNLESSFTFDEQVDDLKERVNEFIPDPLLYASRYWGDHLCITSTDPTLHSADPTFHSFLDEFLSCRLLFWMEVLNLNKWINQGASALLKVQAWITTGRASPNILRLVDDARNFVASFASSPISLSTPHIYISALPFIPRSSSICSNYRKHMRGLVEVEGTASERRQGTSLVTWMTTLDSQISQVVLSSDGTRAACGDSRGTIYVWNAHNGAPVADPLQGHTKRICLIEFSPDGKNLLSGSDDCTIRVWDIHASKLAAGPFEVQADEVESAMFSPDGSRVICNPGRGTLRVWNVGAGQSTNELSKARPGYLDSVAFSPDHTSIVSCSQDGIVRITNAPNGTTTHARSNGHTGCVRSVAFSPDGTRLATGSDDCTICIWGADRGTFVAKSLGRDIGSVRSVAFSPDGTRIVSGLDDCTICVWDAHNVTLLAGPFEGHTDWVNSAAFSPDGNLIVSGSSDRTVRVRSANDGSNHVGPYDQHTGGVNSVSFSPDGNHIASGSDDCTVHIWNLQNPSQITEPLVGHSARVSSVVFSPNGEYIASGSDDCTVRVWNSQNGAPLAGPFSGHADWVRSVSFSPDNTFIVSGSYDYSICIWDARDGTRIADPLEGHADAVMTVAFSPDGTHIASGSNDCTVRTWDIRSFREEISASIEAARVEKKNTSIEGIRIAEDGWVTNYRSERLIWVPQDMRALLPMPRNDFVIGSRGTLRINFNELALGKEWANCMLV